MPRSASPPDQGERFSAVSVREYSATAFVRFRYVSTRRVLYCGVGTWQTTAGRATRSRRRKRGGTATATTRSSRQARCAAIPRDTPRAAYGTGRTVLVGGTARGRAVLVGGTWRAVGGCQRAQAEGQVPYFVDLDECPAASLYYFPKQLVPSAQHSTRAFDMVHWLAWLPTYLPAAYVRA